MPRLSVWMLRLSLVSLLIGSGAGAMLLSGVALKAGPPALRSGHLDLMLFGWLVQFVLGVAYWILPRDARAPDRGPVGLAWAAFWVFQAGLIAVLAGAAGVAPQSATPSGRVLLTAATLLFLVLLGPRVRSSG